MILELDSSLFNKIEDLSINQLVFLTLCLNNNQTNHQDIHQFLSRISETEIQQLIDNGYIAITTLDNNTVYKTTDKLKEILGKKEDFFQLFYDTYPIYVTRPDGTKGFLRGNINKCRKEFNRIIGQSSAMAEHLLECLNFDIQEKTMYGKLGYFKTMWKWLVQHEWESIEEQMKYNSIETYGTAIS